MLIFSIGLPGLLAEWCDHTINALAGRSGASALVSANALDELGRAVIRTDLDRLVVTARQPTQALSRAVAETGSRLVLALDQPRAALHNLVVRHGADLAAATRATASSCASMLAFSGLAGAMKLRVSEVRDDPVGATEAIAHYVGVRPSARELEDAAEPLRAILGQTSDEVVEDWWLGLDETQRAMAEGALGGYYDALNGGGLGELIWTRELFFLGDDPYRPASRVLELAGDIRNLLFGPYVALPAGSWTATVSLAVSKEANGISFGVECLAGPRCLCLARTNAVPNHQGLCQATIGFSIDASTEQPIALRVANLEPAFGGRVALGHIALTTQSEASLPPELSAALEMSASQSLKNAL